MSISLTSTTGLPLLIAAGALLLAALYILAPAAKPLARRLVVAEAAVVPMGLAAYGLTWAGFAPEPLSLLFTTSVIGSGLFARRQRWLPPLAALMMVAGYMVATAAVMPQMVLARPALLLVASITSAGLLMGLVSQRSRRSEMSLVDEADRLNEVSGKLEAENSAIRESTEVASAVLEVANGVTAALDPSAIADQIARATGSQLRAVGTVLLLWDEALETFRVGAIHGPHQLGATDLRQVEVRPETLPTLGLPANGEVVQLAPNSVR
ncbi:MAG: hypothetical protein ACRERC_16775, partial [Candidatus Binatia bacterium]